MDDRPILAVDVDGVISLFGFDRPPPTSLARFELIDGTPHCVSLAAGPRLIELSRGFEMVWATGWEERANDRLAPILGLPDLPVVRFGAGKPFGSAHWKLAPLERHAAGRPLAWIDDCLDQSCVDWAKRREADGLPTLLVPTESHLGIEAAHVDALLDWARDLSHT